MTEALLALQNDNCDEPLDVQPIDTNAINEGDRAKAAGGWSSVLHGDIKPQNIFCANYNETYPSYPRVLLADFDSLQKVNRNPQRYVGTPGWQPPVSLEHGMYHITLIGYLGEI
jgi:serine/threonine protein kinase